MLQQRRFEFVALAVGCAPIPAVRQNRSNREARRN
jgi:hypothetical protein